MAFIKQVNIKSGKKVDGYDFKEKSTPYKKTCYSEQKSKYKILVDDGLSRTEAKTESGIRYKIIGKDHEDKSESIQEVESEPKTQSEEEIETEENDTLSSYSIKFIEDWTKCRDRHPGQRKVLKAAIVEKCQYIFYRAGRKGAKTTSGIDAAWYIANTAPNRVVYLCYPTIAQGIEVVWEERRLQTCDQKNDEMFNKYVEKVDDSRHIVRFANGSFIKLVGTWTEARGRGTQPDAIIFDEVQDCSPEYIEAMDSNLAAKENSLCIMMGTPPKKRNHYEEWYARIQNHPRGKVFHFTSYENIRLPHLKEWLDSKKIELTKAGKEDVWLREYMAELCYSSSDRVLPDIKFLEELEIEQKSRLFSFEDRIPVLAISVHSTYLCAILAILNARKMVLVMDHMVFPQIWNRAFSEMYPALSEKVKILQDQCGKKIRNIVWDESDSFIDVISGFSKCRKDLKWQERGIPILREMIIKEKIVFSRNVADFGLECQNMLIEESAKDVQKNYPHVCTLSMMVNEYFSQDKIAIHNAKPFDKYEAFREMGIPCPATKKRKSLFIKN